MRDFVAIDFETANGARTSICSVGAVRVQKGKIVDTFYSLVRPTPAFFHPMNIAVHGIMPHDVKSAPTFDQVWTEGLQAFIGELPLVAHNKAFDESCLKKTLEFYALPPHIQGFYCTLLQSKRVLRDKLPNHRLPTVATFCGYDLTQHHDALADAKACAYIALQLFQSTTP